MSLQICITKLDVKRHDSPSHHSHSLFWLKKKKKMQQTGMVTVFYIRKKAIQVWNNSSMKKWDNFHFSVNCPFKSYPPTRCQVWPQVSLRANWKRSPALTPLYEFPFGLKEIDFGKQTTNYKLHGSCFIRQTKRIPCIKSHDTVTVLNRIAIY